MTIDGALVPGSDPSAVSATMVRKGKYLIKFDSSRIVACSKIVEFDEAFPVLYSFGVNSSLKEVMVQVFDLNGFEENDTFKLTMLCRMAPEGQIKRFYRTALYCFYG